MQGFAQVVFYLSWLYVPAMALLFWAWRRGTFVSQGEKYCAIGLALGLTILAYARFVEPRILLTKHHDIEICKDVVTSSTIKVAVFSDTHNGKFKNAMPLSRIVKRVNAIAPDLVLLPGDLTYYPQVNEIDNIFAALANVNVPVFAVMGNHDEGVPGPNLNAEVSAALKSAGVIVLDPGHHVSETRDGRAKIVGFKDHWYALGSNGQHGRKNDESFEGPIIYLQHNAEMLMEVPKLGTFDLMVAGHTHGGQINLPFITCGMTFACDIVRYGYKEFPEGRVFVTSGTGMVGLPMRFNVPPVIDVLNITTRACKE